MDTPQSAFRNPQFLWSPHTDSRLNLALEEYLLRHAEGAFFLLYVNEPAVIIGRNQNVWQEANLDYLATHDIALRRRSSGGGAVYHDAGNLNFSFILPDRSAIHDYGRFTTPIIQALARLGVVAEMRDKGAIFVGPHKISGHAQYATTHKILSHGTLLFDAAMPHLRQSLRPPWHFTQSSAVTSVRSPVINLRELLPPAVTLADLSTAIAAEVVGDQTFASTPPTAVFTALAQKYDDWEWTYGRSPRCRISQSAPLPIGPCDMALELKNGRIHNITFYPTTFDHPDPAPIATTLIGLPYTRTALTHHLQSLNLTPYFGADALPALTALIYT